jgi:two-component system, NarL family, response regulator NreC
MSALTILLADDHMLVRQGLRRILEEQREWSVEEATDGRDAVARAVARPPQVAILDIAMPGLNGIDAARQIARRVPSTHVMMLSMHAREEYVVQAVQAGVRGYVLKDSADTDLVQAVQAVSADKSYFSPAVAGIMLTDYMRHLTAKGVEDRYTLLSEREREVFQLIAEGRSNKEIAVTLGLSPATVETHRAHILQKLDVHNTAELVLFAVRRGIIS